MDKKLELRKYKSLATGLFVLMAITYIAMLYCISVSAAAWMYYVKAFSEAAMVGALADWFAVTALFKYPLGLKIPHTNLIESNKNKIGENLGDFVTDNFLTPETIRPYIQDLDTSKYLIAWMEKPSSIENISREVSHILQDTIRSIDSKLVTSFVHKQLQDNLSKFPFSSLVSQAVQVALKNKEQDKLLDAILPQVKSYILNNKPLIYDKVVEKQPILGLIGGKSITNQLIEGLNSFLTDLEQDPTHPIRKELYDKIWNWSEELLADPIWQDRILELVGNHLTPELTQKYMTSIWEHFASKLDMDLAEESSLVRKYIKSGLEKFYQDFKINIKLQDKLNLWIQFSLYKMILRNTKELSHLIERTVRNWDGKDLSTRLELEVGKDLQFIRVNGTLVGGLVGLFIYIATAYFLA